MVLMEPLGQVSQPPERAVRGDRVARTREAIIAATLSLAMNGEVAPIVRDIAMLAGVSARTVFQHFADTTELYVAVLNRVLVAVVAELPDPNPAMSLDRRIDVMVDNRATHFDKLVAMWPFVQALQQRSTDAAEQLLHMYSASRIRLAQWFDVELSQLSDTGRERTLNALSMSLAPEGWIVLRHRLGLAVESSRDEWRFMVHGLLTGKEAGA
jgi:AcrR family transcriptional regulator